MKFKIAILIASVFSLCFKCGNKEITEEENFFNLSEAYYQKFIPGTEDGEKKYELGFKIENLNEDVVLDSLYYKEHVFQSIKIKDDKWISYSSEKNTIAFQSASGYVINNEAILFYSHFNQVYFCYVTDIVTRKTIYLP